MAHNVNGVRRISMLEDCGPRWIVTDSSYLFQLCNRCGVRTGASTLAEFDWERESRVVYGPNLLVIPICRIFGSEAALRRYGIHDFETILSRAIRLSVGHVILPEDRCDSRGSSSSILTFLRVSTYWSQLSCPGYLNPEPC